MEITCDYLSSANFYTTNSHRLVLWVSEHDFYRIISIISIFFLYFIEADASFQLFNKAFVFQRFWVEHLSEVDLETSTHRPFLKPQGHRAFRQRWRSFTSVSCRINARLRQNVATTWPGNFCWRFFYCFGKTLVINTRRWQLKYVLFSPHLGKWSNLASIFFRWVETTN